MIRFPPHLNEINAAIENRRIAADENNARIARDAPPANKFDDYCQGDAVCETRELLQKGHVQAALVELREAIDLTPNDSPWYEAMVSAAVQIEAGNVLNARIILHQAIARLEPARVEKKWN